MAQAKTVARDWVSAEAGQIPGFAGAFFHGSINWLRDDEIIAPSSDVDIMVVIDGSPPDVKLGKFRYQGVLVEVSFVALSDLADPEHVLGVSHLAGSFATASVIADPTATLATLHQVVAQSYADPIWVRRRVADAASKLDRFYAGLDPAAPTHANAMFWVFGTSVPTLILLNASLRNPTVRKRYLQTRALLLELGLPDVYESLLDQLGCRTITPERVSAHVDRLAEVFDAAKTVGSTSVFFASDLTDEARPIAIDGSRDLIAKGLHCEAVFWIVVTYTRCLTVLASREAHRWAAPFLTLLADLGITSYEDMERRADIVRAGLPEIWAIAEAIIESGPASRPTQE